jgi:hypothetical protein
VVQPATLRRLLVFGVCALGVAGLYLVPSVADSPSRVSDARTEEDPPTTPRAVGYVTQQPVPRADPGREATRSEMEGRANPAATATLAADRAAGPAQQAGEQTNRRAGGAAARERGESPDRTPPSTVTDLSFPNVTAERVTIRWAPAADNVGVTGYRIWLNGFRIADTTNVEVAVRWFNDGSPEQVVQVRAVDAAGNQSSDAPARLVVRPLPAPATESSDASEPSTTPGSTGKPSADPSDGDSVE